MVDLTQYISPSEAARRLGVSGEQTRHLMKTGRLPSLESPNGRLVHERDVADLAARRAADRDRRGRG